MTGVYFFVVGSRGHKLVWTPDAILIVTTRALTTLTDPFPWLISPHNVQGINSYIPVTLDWAKNAGVGEGNQQWTSITSRKSRIFIILSVTSCYGYCNKLTANTAMFIFLASCFASSILVVLFVTMSASDGLSCKKY